jgi:hypothetical protein
MALIQKKSNSRKRWKARFVYARSSPFFACNPPHLVRGTSPTLLVQQNDEIDDLFNFSTDADESGADLEFDASELEQIEMLETYRSNLVAAADSPSSGQKI